MQAPSVPERRSKNELLGSSGHEVGFQIAVPSSKNQHLETGLRTGEAITTRIKQTRKTKQTQKTEAEADTKDSKAAAKELGTMSHEVVNVVKE